MAIRGHDGYIPGHRLVDMDHADDITGVVYR